MMEKKEKENLLDTNKEKRRPHMKQTKRALKSSPSYTIYLHVIWNEVLESSTTKH
jgi:hypothetical protein